MISDILSEVVTNLDHYLNDPIYSTAYSGETRERLLRLRHDADELRSTLDVPPPSPPAADDRSDQTGSTRSEMIDRMMSIETAFEIATPYFSRADLLRRRWTKPLIDQLLGEPDWKDTNPHCPGAAPMLCWRQDRVLIAEDTPEFKEHQSRKSGLVGAQP
jgi:hypothetical protein